MDRQALQEAYNRFGPEAEQNSVRSTSVAKELDPHALEGTTLDQAPDIAQQFEANRGEIASERLDGEGSQQVKDASASLDSRPDPAIARPVDREAHQAEMARDDAAAKMPDYAAMAADIAAREAAADRSHDQEHTPD